MGVFIKIFFFVVLLELLKLCQVEYNYGWNDFVLFLGYWKVVQVMVEIYVIDKLDGYLVIGNGCGVWKR